MSMSDSRETINKTMKQQWASILFLSLLLPLVVALQVIDTPNDIQIRPGDNLHLSLNAKEIFRSVPVVGL